MVNKVILVGRLTADPDVRSLPTGTQVTNLRIATNTYGGKEEDGTRKEFTDFHTVVCFNRTAEIAGSYLRKGRLVYIEGRLQHRSWDAPDGTKRHSTEVVVDTLQLLGPRPADDRGTSAEQLPEAVGM